MNIPTARLAPAASLGRNSAANTKDAKTPTAPRKVRAARALFPCLFWLASEAACTCEPGPRPKYSDAMQASGLTQAEEADFFHLPEGSAIIPLSFLRALEVPKSEALFMDGLERYGLIPDPHDTGGLPIGLATEAVVPPVFGDWVGVNCAACHVGRVMVDGKQTLLVGAPAQFDAGAFFDDLGDSVGNTLKDHGKRSRFLMRLLDRETRELMGAFDDAAIVAKVTSQERMFAIEKEQRVVASLDGIEKFDATPTSLFCGTATMDMRLYADLGVTSSQQKAALGSFWDSACQVIKSLEARYEQLARIGANKVKKVTPGPGRVDAFGGARNALFEPDRDLDAPVAFPHLWGIRDIDWFHWDGNTNSILERNIGQAIGLGALVLAGDDTSVRLDNVETLEKLAWKIAPPKWPFAPPSEVSVTAGREVFVQTCEPCHEIGTTTLLAEADFDGLDPNRAKSFAVPILGDKEFAAAIAEKMRSVLQAEHWTSQGAASEWRTTMSYRARDLRGVWATAPYLHNNSVRTLAQLLTPPDEREEEFWTGGTKYDVDGVGFADERSITTAKFSTGESGNGNGGHRYGTELSPEKKKALLDYLKTL